MGTKKRISKKRNWEQRVLMASSLRPTNVNKINASRYGKLTLVRNAAVGSLLPQEVRSKLRRLRGLTFAFVLCASTSSLFATGGIIGTDEGNQPGPVDNATTIYGKLSAVRDLIDASTSPSLTIVAGIQEVAGNTNYDTEPAKTYGIIGADSGSVKDEPDILSKLIALKVLLDSDSNYDGSTTTPNTITNSLISVIGDSGVPTYGTIGGASGDVLGDAVGLAPKITAIAGALKSGETNVDAAIIAIMGEVPLSTPPT
ncbi:MAG: hypothetical protein V6Z78_05010 [Holosporaceae bacterium]